jgi:hypothetical protein
VRRLGERGVGGCSSSGDRLRPVSGIDPAAQAQLDRLRGLPFTADSLRPVEEVLRAAGGGVVDDVTSSPQGLTLTRWQVTNLAAPLLSVSAKVSMYSYKTMDIDSKVPYSLGTIVGPSAMPRRHKDLSFLVRRWRHGLTTLSLV